MSAAESSILAPSAISTNFGMPAAAPRNSFFKQKEPRLVPAREIVIPDRVIGYMLSKAPDYLTMHPETVRDEKSVRIFHQNADPGILKRSDIYSHLPHEGQWQMLKRGAHIGKGDQAWATTVFTRSICLGHFNRVPGCLMGEPIAQLLAAWVIAGIKQNSLAVTMHKSSDDLSAEFLAKGGVGLTEICGKPFLPIVPGEKVEACLTVQSIRERGSAKLFAYGFLLNKQGQAVFASIVEGMPHMEGLEKPLLISRR